MKFVKCNHCGNILVFMDDKGVIPHCCGEEMEILSPGSTDGAFEKHVPVVEQDGCKVKVTVGSTIHPMMDARYICWIAVETDCGCYKRDLKPGMEPKAEFTLCDGEKVVAVYEYCNLHGLWKAE